MTTLGTASGLIAALTLSLCPPTPDQSYHAFRPELDLEWAAGPSEEGRRKAQEVSSGFGDPADVGQWSAVMPWPVIAIHAATLPTGQVMHYSYPQQSVWSRAYLWDPQTGEHTETFVNSDVFCSGLTFLPDGDLYVVGGNNTNCSFQGRLTTFRFDMDTEQWSLNGVMADGRWYPTPVRLGDDSVLILSGLNTTCDTNQLMERFTPGVGLELVPGGTFNHALFPRMHLLTNGNVVRVGQENWSYLFNTALEQWMFLAANNFGWRCEGTSVLIPGRTDQILAVGGNCPVTGTAEILDLTAEIPQWRYTNPMHHARAHADAVILPDATVLVVGGGTIDLYNGPVFFPEIFDPETESWTEMAPHAFSRMYHATSVLLPDGRVLVAGQDSGQSMFFAEIFQPPYLFRGVRPVLVNAPTRIAYNRGFSLDVPGAAAISRVNLIAPSAVTHSTNTHQRYVGLDFSVSDGGVLTVNGPPDGNHAPAGYYMLFVVNDNGVPAEAQWVQLIDFTPGDLDGDGVVDTVDFLALLADWGRCPGCNADLDGDGAVTALDMLALLANWG